LEESRRPTGGPSTMPAYPPGHRRPAERQSPAALRSRPTPGAPPWPRRRPAGPPGRPALRQIVLPTFGGASADGSGAAACVPGNGFAEPSPEENPACPCRPTGGKSRSAGGGGLRKSGRYAERQRERVGQCPSAGICHSGAPVDRVLLRPHRPAVNRQTDRGQNQDYARCRSRSVRPAPLSDLAIRIMYTFFRLLLRIRPLCLLATRRQAVLAKSYGSVKAHDSTGRDDGGR